MSIWQKVIIYTLRVLLPIGLVSLVGLVVYVDLDVDGYRKMVHTPTMPHVAINGPSPSSRVAGVFSSDQGTYWTIAIDPVYFDVTLPRSYQAIDITMEYQALGVPLVELGSLVDAARWNFYWQPLMNQTLERIEWPCLIDSSRGLRVCQKEKHYDNIEHFFSTPPATAKIITYAYVLPDTFAGVTVVPFNPKLNIEQFDYFVAQYTPPIPVGQWLKRTVHFPAGTFQITPDRQVQFAVSAPGLDTRGQVIHIKNVIVELHNQPLTWSMFFQKVVNFIRRVA